MDRFVIRKIKALKQVKPDTSWLQGQRSFLLSEVSQEQNKSKEPSLILPVFHFNILKIFKPAFAVALGIIILVSSLGTIGVISAAQNSLPGDFLYPVKTAFEQTQFTFTPGEVSKTKLSIKLANHRMDEFTQLIDKPEKKEDAEKTVKKFTEQLVSVQESMDKLKEKNAVKAAEVAKLVKAQALVYEEALIESRDQLAYVIPEDREDIKRDIDKALVELNKAKEMSEELAPEETLKPSEEGSGSGEEILVPAENIEGVLESASVQSEDLQQEFIPQQEEE